jgi:hypothetical protein
MTKRDNFSILERDVGDRIRKGNIVLQE